MVVGKVQLWNYRNIAQLMLEFHPDTNLIFGENAQGKTNLMESMVYLSTGKSHRAMSERELIKMGESACRIEAEVESFQRVYHLDAMLRQGTRRKLERNGVKATKFQEFSDVFHTVLFCPEDLSLVKSAPSLRRQFLDVAISQLRPQYGQALAEYKRLFLHKSKILREREPSFLETLPDFNQKLIETGTMIVHYRAHFIKRLQEVVPVIHEEFAGGRERVTLSYKTVSTVTDSLASEQVLYEQIKAHQESHFQAELGSGRVLTGPHKDDIMMWIEGREARSYASQGQTRTLALSLKLGEREISQQETGEYPVLLLDDVLSELDRGRQEFVLNRIKTGQVFITTCEEEGFLGLCEGAKFRMAGGVACPV